MTYRPFFDRVVLRIERAEEKERSGIFIPTTAQNTRESAFARVVDVGPGRYLPNGELKPVTVPKGARVVFYPEQAAPIPGEPDLVVVNEGDVLVAVE